MSVIYFNIDICIPTNSTMNAQNIVFGDIVREIITNLAGVVRMLKVADTHRNKLPYVGSLPFWICIWEGGSLSIDRGVCCFYSRLHQSLFYFIFMVVCMRFVPFQSCLFLCLYFYLSIDYLIHHFNPIYGKM